ncbi:MAG: hypothetical protein AAB446_01165 [Patescibacteria group bacterium]
MARKEIPAKVQEAILNGDKEMLREYARRGGIMSGRAKRAKRQVQREQEDELARFKSSLYLEGVREKLRQGNEIDFPPR